MQEQLQKNWLDQLEVTGPIKGIMDFVDELSRNYDRRLAALHIDYQKDVEELLACYKQEKEDFNTQLAAQTKQISSLQNELKSVRQNYNALKVEHKLNKESLTIAQDQLAELTKTLKHEEELVALTKEKIRVANESLKIELANSAAPACGPTVISSFVDDGATVEDLIAKPKKIRFRRAKEFMQRIVADRLSRKIILQTEKQAPIIAEQIEDQDEYSF